MKKLSKGEFCQFNIKSRMQLLRDDGTFLFEKKINETCEIKIFMVYAFYVVVFFNNMHNKVEKVEPVQNQQWVMNFFIDTPITNNASENFSEN